MQGAGPNSPKSDFEAGLSDIEREFFTATLNNPAANGGDFQVNREMLVAGVMLAFEALCREVAEDPQDVIRGRKIFWGVASAAGVLSFFPRGRTFLARSLLASVCAIFSSVPLFCFYGIVMRRSPAFANTVWRIYWRIMPWRALKDVFIYCTYCIAKMAVRCPRLAKIAINMFVIWGALTNYSRQR